MKTFVLLFLSCASLFGADTSIQIVTTTKTNATSGDTFTQAVFTRDGKTNLVRSTLTIHGKADDPDYNFYRDGFLVGRIWSIHDGELSGFNATANCPYSLQGIYQKHKIQQVLICTKDDVAVDYFIVTNGVIWPASRSQLQDISKLTAATSHMSHTNQPSTKNNAEKMRQLRLKMLAAPTELGLKPT